MSQRPSRTSLLFLFLLPWSVWLIPHACVDISPRSPTNAVFPLSFFLPTVQSPGHHLDMFVTDLAKFGPSVSETLLTANVSGF